MRHQISLQQSGMVTITVANFYYEVTLRSEVMDDSTLLSLRGSSQNNYHGDCTAKSQNYGHMIITR